MSSVGVALSHAPDARFDGPLDNHSPTESILVYVTIPGTPAVPMRVLESDSIASVKLRIQSWKGFVVKKQKLVFDGRELARNNCLVRDYGVGDGNVLHLVIRLSDLRVITVKTACGKKFEFRVERNRRVAYIKRQIARKGEDFVDLEDQNLFYDGEELDDRRLIDDICKSDDAVIHLLVRRSAKVRTQPVANDFEISILAPENKDVTVPRELKVVQDNSLYRDFAVEPVIVNPKVELPPVITNLVRTTAAGLEKGNSPVMSSEGSGGAYFMQDASGQECVAVFKPIDEEPLAKNNPRGLPLSSDGEGLKRGTRVGEGALREVAAYILDHPINGRRSFTSNDGRRSFTSNDTGFSGVPPTAFIRCLHEAFNHPEGFERTEKFAKIGSLQKFMKNYGCCEDVGPRAFPVEEVHKISVLDMRLANTDRHGGNILLCKGEEEDRYVLVPIDHGYCLPENFEDCTFEWLYWPQARQPFNFRTMDYIRSLDAEEDIALLKFYGWELSTECARTLRISTMLLKKGAEIGLTAYDIGSILCRETVKKESVIEEIIREAKNTVPEGSSEASFMETVSQIMDRRLYELTITV